MHSIYRILLFIAYFGIIIHGKGGRVRFRGSGYSSSSCITSECKYEIYVILGYIFGGIVGMVALSVFIVYCCVCFVGRPCKNNQTFVKSSNSNQRSRQLYDVNAFQSGIWLSRYQQDKIWHMPNPFSLSFDPESMKVTGLGWDGAGAFTIDGIYSITTRRIGLTKTYKNGTCNPAENSGHEMIIQLTWNEKNHQFEGKWYVRTGQYKNEDKFQLKFIGQLQLCEFENDNNEQIPLRNYV